MKRTISVIICGLVVLSSMLFATGCGKNAYDIDLSIKGHTEVIKVMNMPLIYLSMFSLMDLVVQQH